MKKTLNSFLINSFKYENYPCICRKEIIYTSPNEKPSYIVKICENNSVNSLKFSFSYLAQNGLNLSGNAGGIIDANNY